MNQEDAIEVVPVLSMDFLKRPPTTLGTIQEQAHFAMSSECQTKKDKASTSDKLENCDMLRQHMNHQACMAYIKSRDQGEDNTTFVRTSDQAEKQPLAIR